MATMADLFRGDRDHTRDPRQIHIHTTQTPSHLGPTNKTNGPSTSQVVALIALLPVSGTLLFLAGLTLVGSIIGLVVTTPVFLLFSPVLVPAALLLVLAVTGILSSGAFGLTGLSSLSRVVMYFRQAGHTVPDDLDYAKRRVADMAAFTGQKTKDVGQTIESKARESGTHPSGTGTGIGTGTTGRT